LAGQIEERLQDAAFACRGRRVSQARIVLIGLDAASLESLRKPALYLSPELAEVVRYVKEQGAAAIGLDLLIPPSYAGLPELQAGGAGDATALGQAILDAGNVVLAQTQQEGRWVLPLPQWRLKAALAPAATDFGFINCTEDADYFVRRQQLYVRDGAQARLQFALALAACAQGTSAEWSAAGLRLGEDAIPLDEEQCLRINFVGPPGAFAAVPFRNVLAAARHHVPPPAELAGAVAIIAVTARDQHDYHATPFSGTSWLGLSRGGWDLMSGSEIHANIAATLLDRAFVRQPPRPVTLFLLLAVGALLGRAFARLNLAWGLGLLVIYLAAWRGLSLALFAGASVRVEILSMLLLGVLVYGLVLLRRWQLLRRMLGVVKSENIARLLEEDPAQLDLRGQERVVTLLFADIRNFTTFAEKHSARGVVTLLNAYFGAVVPILEQHGGTLNQYFGDGMMVIFGAPLTQPDHAVRAVRAGVEMVRKLHALQAQWTALGFAGLRVGVGIHTGRVVIGTVGSPGRQDYSAVGDTTNTAARIEAQNKVFSTEILISAATYQELSVTDRTALGCAAEPRVTVLPGKEQPLELHVVQADATLF
jgi:adenylate cyclase